MGEGILMYGTSRKRIGKAGEKIQSVLEDIRRQGFSRTTPFPVGKIEKRMEKYAEHNGVTLAKGGLYMTSNALAHATRDSKEAKGIAVSVKDLASFPIRRRYMDLYYDTRTGNFTYVDGKSKFIVHPNYDIKLPSGKRKVVNFITAQRLNEYETFNGDRFKKI